MASPRVLHNLHINILIPWDFSICFTHPVFVLVGSHADSTSRIPGSSRDPRQLKLDEFLLACNDGLSLVARDCRSHADLTEVRVFCQIGWTFDERQID